MLPDLPTGSLNSDGESRPEISRVLDSLSPDGTYEPSNSDIDLPSAPDDPRHYARRVNNPELQRQLNALAEERERNPLPRARPPEDEEEEG